MKFEQFAPLQEQQALDEVRMGAGDLQNFATSQDAGGIKAGFEAELCFPGLSGNSTETDYDSPEADYDSDERADDIDDICNFFHDGEYNGRREIQALRESLQEAYWEWKSEQQMDAWGEVAKEKVREYIEENDYDEDDEIRNYLSDHLDLDQEQVQAVIDAGGDPQGNPEAYALYKEAVDYAHDQLNELVDQAMDNQDRSYDNARDEWIEYTDDDYSENDWLRSEGIRYMSDISNEYDIQWPHWIYPETNSEGGFNESAAEDLARDLGNELGVNVRAGSGYHSVSRRPGLWIIEADSSLEADDDDDMPAEIVSPPMPLQECLSKMKEFFDWAKNNNAYSNHSTGLHIGVSLPVVGGKVDYLKLAMFLGDNYVLSEFGRESNYFTRSALEKIDLQVRDMKKSGNIENTLKVLQHGLGELAQKTLKTNANGYGKYTSINPKGDYIEFRSMGNDYMEKTDQVLEIVKRYAYAMYIASRPDLHKQEYTKKLYKLMSAHMGESSDRTAIELFVNYSTGQLDKASLIRQVRAIQSQRPGKEEETPNNPNGWAIIDKRVNRAMVNFMAPSKEHALQKFHDWIAADRNRDSVNYRLESLADNGGDQPQQQAVQPGSTADLQQQRSSGGFSGSWRVVNASGQELYRFGGVGNSQADANRVAAQWAQRNQVSEPFEVLPIMGNN
jgi:hypothetical protein